MSASQNCHIQNKINRTSQGLAVKRRAFDQCDQDEPRLDPVQKEGEERQSKIEIQ
jgi:hypothetical protein